MAAKAIAEGAREVSGNDVDVIGKRVSETLPKEVLHKTGATEAPKAFTCLPIATPAELTDYDAIISGMPTRYGNLCGQMQAFMDSRPVGQRGAGEQGRRCLREHRPVDSV